jgi:hypothetical protein
VQPPDLDDSPNAALAHKKKRSGNTALRAFRRFRARDYRLAFRTSPPIAELHGDDIRQRAVTAS